EVGGCQPKPHFDSGNDHLSPEHPPEYPRRERPAVIGIWSVTTRAVEPLRSAIDSKRAILVVASVIRYNLFADESGRDGFLGRGRGVASALGVPSAHPAAPRPAACEQVRPLHRSRARSAPRSGRRPCVLP